MLFADLVGFTTFSEHRPAEDVVDQLNEYLSAMTDVIFRWNGTLDKFVGDEIVVFWGAPLDQPDHAELAVQCALEMQARADGIADPVGTARESRCSRMGSASTRVWPW